MVEAINDPADAPAEAPIDAAVDAPVEAVVEAVDEAPVEVEAPVQSNVQEDAEDKKSADDEPIKANEPEQTVEQVDEEDIDLTKADSSEEVKSEPKEKAPVVELSEEEKAKFDLLDHLFIFLDSEEELNPVLCGYFSKLVGVFLNRKSKQIYHYVYTHEDGQTLERLAKHVYSKSLTEILIKFLDVQESYFDEPIPGFES